MGWNKDTDLEAQVVIEARLKAMSSELRCLVCQNTTLADSSAPLAEDLRKEIRVQMRAGKSDQEVGLLSGALWRLCAVSCTQKACWRRSYSRRRRINI